MVAMEEDQNQRRLKVSHHEEIQHYETGWDLRNLEYERAHPCHIQGQ